MTVDSVAGSLAARGVAFAPEITQAAARHGVDPTLLAAVAAQETGGPGSNGGRNVVGDGGHGRGLFQIDDRWHAFARTAAAMDPASNAEYAAGMLSGLLGRYHGDVRSALSAYNAGSPTAPGTSTRWPDGQVLDYAGSVMRHYRDLAGAPPVQAAPLAQPVTGASTQTLLALLQELASLGGGASSMPSPPASAPPQSTQPYQPATIDYGSLVDNAD